MPNTPPNLIAGGNIEPSRFVKLSGDFTVVQAGAGEAPIGISQDGSRTAPIPEVSTTLAAAAGDTVRIFGAGDVCPLEAGGTISAAGTYLKSDTAGKGVAATAASEAGAIALQAGADGEKILVQVVLRPLPA